MALAACGPGKSEVTGTWSVVASGTTDSIPSVYAAAPDVAYAVTPTQLLRWDGNTWTAMMQDYIFNTVAGTGANDVWIAGTTVPPAGSGDPGGPVLRRSTGGDFQDTRVTTDTAFLGLFARTPDDAWIVGTGKPLHWDGASWTETANGLPDSPTLFAVWSSGPGTALAAGSEIYRWNGTSWTAEPRVVEGDTEYFFGIYGLAADDVWAVGAKGRAQHWDGTRWTETMTGVTTALRAVWGAAPNDVWAVGDVGVAVHWNGETWTSVTTGATGRLRAISGTGARDIWVSGESGTLLHYH